MTILDAYIERTAEYIEAARSIGRPVKTFSAPPSVGELREGLPVNVGPGASTGLILRADSYLELGNPEAGSAAFLLFTDDSSRVKDGRITLVGPDVQESAGRSLPFGQVLIIGGSGLSFKDYDALRHAGLIGDQIEGYMVRSATRNVWSRVGRIAAERGFGFEALGRALMAIHKSADARIESVEVLFVTSGNEDVGRLGELGAQVQKVAKEIVRENWKVKGIDIECLSNCATCDDKPVCNEIREMLKVKNKAGEIGGT